MAAALALAGCAGHAVGAHTPPTVTATPQPIWQFVWVTTDADQGASPQAAYAASAQARSPDGGLHNPANSWWLATGPNFGLVVSQLDPAGQNMALSVLSRGSVQGPNWMAIVSGYGTRPSVNAGMPKRPLPGSNYTCAGYVAEPAPPFDAMFCLSATETYVFGHFAREGARPTGAPTVTVAGNAGWLVQDNGFASVVVPLQDGETFVFGGTTDPAGAEGMGSEVLSKLSQYVP
ncbi:MAG TPA: hypothetical protein VGS80_07025 [Ktedonobacterales bacterium]|nr:hypothetical protein [Ktedonobacterales bacterium]